MSVDFKEITASVNLFHEALEMLKTLKDLIPKGTKREQVELKLAEAESKAALSKAQFAQLLGYKLCKCAFPPEPMLKNGSIHGAENFTCPRCGANSVPYSRPTRAIMEYDPFDY